MIRWACKNPSLLGSFSASTPFPANGGPAAAQQGGPLYEKADYDGHGNQLSSRRTEDGVLAEESVSTVLPLDEALARQG